MFTLQERPCVQCGAAFTIPLDECIHKFRCDMKLPKRCRDCRRKNRTFPDPYRGLHQIMYQYPATKGHRHQVHGGAF